MNNEFTKWFLLCVTQKYADFNGRARRKEYWMFFLVALIINVILTIIENATGLTIPVGAPGMGVNIGILSSIFGLALLVPSLAAAVRRLHDVNKSGWFVLVALVPLVGAIYLIYLLVIDGTPGPNKYGPSPKGLTA